MAYLMMGAAMILVGSTIVASKLMTGMPVFVAAWLRFAIASPILAGFVLIGRQRLPRLTLREWAVLGAQAGLGSVGYSVLLISGLSLTLASDASVIAGTLPAVAALLSVIVLRERPSRRTVLAIALATLGVGVLCVGNGAAYGGDGARWTGNALVLSSVACEAVFLLLNKTIKTRMNPLFVAAAISTLSLILCTGPALYQFMQASKPVLNAGGVAAAAYYALVPTVLGFYLWYKGASNASGAEAALFTSIYPVAALLLSAAILGEAVEMRHWLGAAIAVLGIALGARASIAASGCPDGNRTRPISGAARPGG